MTDLSKIQPVHRQRAACVYIRQSTPHQMEHNRESTARQYALVERARALGWAREQIHVVDEDLGVSGAGDVERAGFAHLAAEVALGHVGLVMGLEVSRLARNNADWYRLLDLCGMTDTLIGDDDGLYHPGLFNDRLLLGLKGTMSEAERHIIRARLDGGIRNKAARGELRRGLPVGFVWGEADGEVLFHPDAGVCGAIRAVFERFAEFGSARRVWLWFRSEGLDFPLQTITLAEIRWVAASYHAIHQVLTNPVYAGAYAYGKSRHERYVDDQGNIRKRVRKLPREQWAVLIREHHPGYIDWETYEANQTRLAQNTRPRPHQGGGAVREGSALLQGLATCGHCGRRLRTHYRGNNATPGYHCAGEQIVEGRSCYCLNVGGVQIDAAVAKAFLEALTPASTTDRDRKELLRTLLEEAIIRVERAAAKAELTLRWRGGLITELAIDLPRSNPPPIRTEEDTIELVRRLAVHYPDATIAGILNRQDRKTATGQRFTAGGVGNLRRYWKIPRFQPSGEPPQAPLVNIKEAAEILGVAPSTVHRWLNDGFIAGEQITPGAPWRIRLTEELKTRFVEEAPEGFLPMLEATQRLGVSRQTVMQRIKRGELEAVHVCCGKRKGLRIKVNNATPDLFDPSP